MRNAAMPATPTTGNRLLAMAAPRFCDTSDANSASNDSAPAGRCGASTKAVARHGDAAEEVALVVDACRALVFGRAERHHQRQQVLLARVRQARGRRALPGGERGG